MRVCATVLPEHRSAKSSAIPTFCAMRPCLKIVQIFLDVEEVINIPEHLFGKVCERKLSLI